MKLIIGLLCGVALQFYYPEFGQEFMEIVEDALRSF